MIERAKNFSNTTKPYKLQNIEELIKSSGPEIDVRTQQFYQLRSLIERSMATLDEKTKNEITLHILEVKGQIDIALNHQDKMFELQSKYTEEWKAIGRVRQPGQKLEIMSEFLFSKKFFSNVIFPLISDMREEYFEALSQNRMWKARWVRVRGTWSFFAAIGLDRAFALVSFFIKAWKSVN
jgi:hypothetical protein